MGEGENHIDFCHRFVEKIPYSHGQLRFFQIFPKRVIRWKRKDGVRPGDEHDPHVTPSQLPGQLFHVPERPYAPVILIPGIIDSYARCAGHPLNQAAQNSGFQSPPMCRGYSTRYYEGSLRPPEANRYISQVTFHYARLSRCYSGRYARDGLCYLCRNPVLRLTPHHEIPQKKRQEILFPPRVRDEPPVGICTRERQVGLHVIPLESILLSCPRQLPCERDGIHEGLDDIGTHGQEEVGILDPVVGHLLLAKENPVCLF